MKPLLSPALLTAFAILAGCSMTPNQAYKLDATLYNGSSIALGIAHKDGKIDDDSWKKIQAVQTQAKLRLAEARVWLGANPALARTPGYPIPALDPAGVAISILLTYATNFDLVDMSPPEVPATQPGGLQ